MMVLSHWVHASAPQRFRLYSLVFDCTKSFHVRHFDILGFEVYHSIWDIIWSCSEFNGHYKFVIFSNRWILNWPSWCWVTGVRRPLTSSLNSLNSSKSPCNILLVSLSFSIHSSSSSAYLSSFGVEGSGKKFSMAPLRLLCFSGLLQSSTALHCMIFPQRSRNWSPGITKFCCDHKLHCDNILFVPDLLQDCVLSRFLGFPILWWEGSSCILLSAAWKLNWYQNHSTFRIPLGKGTNTFSLVLSAAFLLKGH